MRKGVLFIIFCTGWSQEVHAEIRLGTETAVAFASVTEGRELLTARDDFVRRMSPFDRAARMGRVVCSRRINTRARPRLSADYFST